MRHIRILLTVLLFLTPALQAQVLTDAEDLALMDRVNQALGKDDLFNDADILVVSVHGYVMLAGQVLSEEQKQEASVVAAFAAKNIRRLINELEVVDALDHSFDADDRKILDQIVAVIPDISPATVPVIHHGVVHLLGQVTRTEGDKVATTISKMPGVKGIRLSYEYMQ